jgi:hypothetical protein
MNSHLLSFAQLPAALADLQQLVAALINMLVFVTVLVL